VVLTTQKVDLSYAIVDTVGDIMDGSFENASRSYGVGTPATGLGPVNAKVDPATVEQVERWRAAIADGVVDIPGMIGMGESQTLPLLSLPE